ncbi:MAG: twin-arginine translocation signal domain-containing protein [Chloroflexi bacterium]|nr:twin-arginine translocation signal domain-containing protein [Chloroflexota bacterium]
MQAELSPRAQSRRTFLKRIALGVAGVSAAAAVSGQAGSSQSAGTGLPGPGSIFEPRKADLRSHWAQKLSRFRLW